MLMRFGLADVRNYDSVELARSLEWFAPLYAHDGSTALQPRRRDVGDRGEGRRPAARIGRQRDRCRTASARRSRSRGSSASGRCGSHAWTANPGPIPSRPRPGSTSSAATDGRVSRSMRREPDRLVIRETWDPGWRAAIDGSPSEIQAKNGVFLSVVVPKGNHQLILSYDPAEVRLGLAISLVSLVLVILVLTEIRLLWIPGIELARGLEGAEPPS